MRGRRSLSCTLRSRIGTPSLRTTPLVCITWLTRWREIVRMRG